MEFDEDEDIYNSVMNDPDVLSMIDAMIEHVEHTAKEHPTNLY